MKVGRWRLIVLVCGTAMALSAPASATSPSAPSAIKVVNSCHQQVAAGHYACFALRRTDLGFTSQAHLAAAPHTAPKGYGPADLQSAYALASAAGSSASAPRVYVVDALDDPAAESDLATYRSQYGLPPCTTANGCFRKLNQTGATSPLPRADTKWAGEESLDVDMVSAICPKCSITLIEANDSDINLFAAVREAVTLGAAFVSMSWGGRESGSDASLDSAYFKPSGVVYTAATGDDAYPAGVVYPATSPAVVAVGGTSLSVASTARGWSEKVWDDKSPHQGTGSGCSSDEDKPIWQGIIATSTCTRRADSDVSAVADPGTGVAVYQTYGGTGWGVYGGTSAAAPIIASVYALAGTPTAATKPASIPYAHTANLNDVTSGNNGRCTHSLLCTAATGWDGPTGLGTPNGTAAFGGAGGRSSCSGQKVTNPGFESGTTGWTKTTDVINKDSAHAHAGTGYARLDGYGRTHTDTLSQAITIPATCKATMTYYLHIQSSESSSGSAHDTLTVTANGRTVQSFSNVDEGSGYVRRSVSLSSYAGRTVTMRWAGIEDSSGATSFFIDDATVTLSRCARSCG